MSYCIKYYIKPERPSILLSKWKFCVAVIPNPIIGADMIAYYHLVPFPHESCLVHTNTTGLSVHGFVKSALICSISIVNHDHSLSNFLAVDPELTPVLQRTAPPAGDVQHHIII